MKNNPLAEKRANRRAAADLASALQARWHEPDVGYRRRRSERWPRKSIFGASSDVTMLRLPRGWAKHGEGTEDWDINEEPIEGTYKRSLDLPIGVAYKRSLDSLIEPATQQRDVAAFLIEPSTPVDAQDQQLFEDLASEWRDDTLVVSSLIDKVLHPAYQRIIGMGRSAIPLILRELERGQAYWYWALAAILGEDVARDANDLDDARERWLEWGRTRGYLTQR